MFVVAECDGADRMAQDYLLACGVAPKSINVYHMLKAPRYLANHNIPTIGGYTSDLQRDEAMTRTMTLLLSVRVKKPLELLKTF